MSTKHKSINPDTIDFSATELTSGLHGMPHMWETSIKENDTIGWLNIDGECVASLLVSTVLKWIEANNLHVPEDMEAHECDSLKWLDDNFESATKDYFMAVYAEESEVTGC